MTNIGYIIVEAYDMRTLKYEGEVIEIDSKETKTKSGWITVDEYLKHTRG